MRGESEQRGGPPSSTAASVELVRDGAGAPASWGQRLVCFTLIFAIAAAFASAPFTALNVAHHGLAGLFLAAAAWRVALILLARSPEPAPLLADDQLPAYTAIVPLYREAAMIGQIIGALERLDYPRERLQVILALEADDPETIGAAKACQLPAGFEVLVVPPGRPRTKPRACNHALARATGALVTIYDAEDRPDTGQLREAAARFAAGPQSLACVQAPLRIALGPLFLSRQFALEYAALFELTLPALARLGMPFPLGGTSNHFRTAVLRELGGWDAYNVTEDADLGFRLGRSGYGMGVLTSPTHEDAPEALHDWLPQRTRWLKGYMQTLGVQTRRGLPPPRVAAALVATVGTTLGSAAIHLPMSCWLLTYLCLFAMGGPGPSLTPLDLAALIAGVGSAMLAHAVGARRAGLRASVLDVISAPLYWPLLTLAFLHALPRLVFQPHHWDKTPHKPWLFPPR